MVLQVYAALRPAVFILLFVLAVEMFYAR